MKSIWQWLAVFCLASVGEAQTISYFNQGFLRQPSAAADRTYLGILGNNNGTNYIPGANISFTLVGPYTYSLSTPAPMPPGSLLWEDDTVNIYFNSAVPAMVWLGDGSITNLYLRTDGYIWASNNITAGGKVIGLQGVFDSLLVSNASFSGVISGNGSGITNISLAAMPTNVAYVNSNNVFTGSINIFSNASFSGVISGDGSGITNLSLAAMPTNVAYVNSNNVFRGSLNTFSNMIASGSGHKLMTGGADMVTVTNNRVGINTNDPQALLHINNTNNTIDEIRMNANIDRGAFPANVYTPVANNYRIYTGRDNTSTYYMLGIVPPAGKTLWYSREAGAWSANASRFQFISAADDTNEWGGFEAVNLRGLSLGTYLTRPISFWPNRAVAMRIGGLGGVSIGSTFATADAAANNLIVQGKIGVGTNSPTELLEVVGSTAPVQRFTVTSGGSGNFYAGIDFYNSGGLSGQFTATAGNYLTAGEFVKNTLALQSWGTSGKLMFATRAANPIEFLINGYQLGSVVMYMDVNRNVTIGNTNTYGTGSANLGLTNSLYVGNSAWVRNTITSTNTITSLASVTGTNLITSAVKWIDAQGQIFGALPVASSKTMIPTVDLGDGTFAHAFSRITGPLTYGDEIVPFISEAPHNIAVTNSVYGTNSLYVEPHFHGRPGTAPVAPNTNVAFRIVYKSCTPGFPPSSTYTRDITVGLTAGSTNEMLLEFGHLNYSTNMPSIATTWQATITTIDPGSGQYIAQAGSFFILRNPSFHVPVGNQNAIGSSQDNAP